MSERPRLRHPFKVGGAVGDDGSLYVHREADRLLPEALLRGDYAYVLAPRQIGKSSLQARTQKGLRREGIACVTIDLEGFGLRDSTAANGYFDLLAEIAAQLDLPYPDRFWERHNLLTPVQRFLRYLREEVLYPLAPRPLVLFFDEIEEVFPHAPALRDDFFAAMRYLYNQRVSDPAYQRLTVCLTGVASPMDLIRDAARTPFNVGRGIALHDFSRAEVDELAPGFRDLDAAIPVLLDEVWRWTGGQPYMTQKLCDALLTRGVTRGEEEAAVHGVVAELFFRQRSLAVAEPHLSHAARYFERVSSDPRAARMLALYKRLLREGSLPADPKDAVQIDLRLTGLAVERVSLRPDGGVVLAVRNPVYAQVFDEAWIREREGLRPLTGLRERWELSGRAPRELPRGGALRALLRELPDESALTPEERELLLAARLQEDRARFRTRLLGIASGLIVATLLLSLWQQAEQKRTQQRAAQAEVRAILSEKLAAQAEARRQKAEVAREQEETLRYLEAKQKEDAELRERMASAEKQAYGARLLAERLRSQEKDARLREEERGRARAAARSRDLEEDAEAKQQRIITLLSQAERVARDLTAAQRRVGDLEGELMRARGQLARAWPAQHRVLLAVSAGLRAVAPLLGEGEEARAHGAQPEHVPERAEAVRGLGEAARALLALGVGDSGARGRLYRELRHPALVYQVAFEPGGRWLYTMCEDGKVRRFSVPGGRELSGFLGDASPMPFVAAVAPGGRDGGASAGRASSAGRYLLTRQGGPFGGDSRRLWLWDLQREGVAALGEPGAAASGEPQLLAEHRAPVLAAVFSADGALLLTGSEDRSARLWQRAPALPSLADPRASTPAGATYRPLALLGGARGPVRAVAFSRDGRTLITGAADGAARVYEGSGRLLAVLGPVAGSESPRLAAGLRGGVHSVELTRDGERALVLGDDGTARLWDTRHRVVLHGLRGADGGRVQAAQLSEDGRLVLLRGADGALRLLDSGTAGERLRLGGAGTAEGRQRAAILSGARGETLLCAGEDGVARMVAAPSGAPLLYLPGAAGGGARALALLRSGDATLAVVGEDQVVRLYPGGLRPYVAATCEILRTTRECQPPASGARDSEADRCDYAALISAGVCPG